MSDFNPTKVQLGGMVFAALTVIVGVAMFLFFAGAAIADANGRAVAIAQLPIFAFVAAWGCSNFVSWVDRASGKSFTPIGAAIRALGGKILMEIKR